MKQRSIQQILPPQKTQLCLYYSVIAFPAFPLATLFLYIKPHLWLLIFRTASLKATYLATTSQLTGICSICIYSFQQTAHLSLS